jgi:hypothetical protein
MFALLFLSAIFLSSQAHAVLLPAPFDIKQANISVWLSAAAFCNVGGYKEHVFQGPTTGFEVTAPIYDARTDAQGYVGVLPSDKSIYVVFRGSGSTRNWIANLDAWKVDYTSFPECNCKVHKGFYEAEQAVIGAIIKEVTRLKQLHPKYAVKVTGHSLGAALSQLASMDLYKAGFDVSVYNYGQPRTGDKAYATFATERVPTWRVTHNRDEVPHLPFTKGMEYYHVCQEQFEDEFGNLRTCDTSCEDPTCADQFKANEVNGDDHLIYLGLVMSCEAVSGPSN